MRDVALLEVPGFLVEDAAMVVGWPLVLPEDIVAPDEVLGLDTDVGGCAAFDVLEIAVLDLPEKEVAELPALLLAAVLDATEAEVDRVAEAVVVGLTALVTLDEAAIVLLAEEGAAVLALLRVGGLWLVELLVVAFEDVFATEVVEAVVVCCCPDFFVAQSVPDLGTVPPGLA